MNAQREREIDDLRRAAIAGGRTWAEVEFEEALARKLPLGAWAGTPEDAREMIPRVFGAAVAALLREAVNDAAALHWDELIIEHCQSLARRSI